MGLYMFKLFFLFQLKNPSTHGISSKGFGKIGIDCSHLMTAWAFTERICVHCHGLLFDAGLEWLKWKGHSAHGGEIGILGVDFQTSPELAILASLACLF